MDFTSVPTPILIKTWQNLVKGLDEVAKTLDDGTFHTVRGEKGSAPPSQAGQTTLWFLTAVDAELTKRGITERSENAKPRKARPRR